MAQNVGKGRALYGARGLGFAEGELHRWLEDAGFKKVEVGVVAREDQPPHFQTLLGSGMR